MVFLTEEQYADMLNAQPVGTHYVSYLEVLRKQTDGTWISIDRDGDRLVAQQIATVMRRINENAKTFEDPRRAWTLL